MTPTILAEYAEDLKGQPTLGHIVFYAVERLQMQWADLKDLLDRLGLGDYVPSRPADVDVFRRVATSIQTQRVPTDDPGIYVNILVRDVAGDKDLVVKRIVAEEVNPAGKRLRYTETHDLIFHRNLYNRIGLTPAEGAAFTQAQDALADYLATKGEGYDASADVTALKLTDDLAAAKTQLDAVLKAIGNVEVRVLADKDTHRQLSEDDHPAAFATAARVMPDYVGALGTVDANAVRSLMCRILDKVHAIRLRKTGGVFFVPKTHITIVDALCEFATLVPAAEFEPAPLVDTKRLRDLVKRSAESEVTAEIDAKITEVNELLAKGEKVSPRKMKAILVEFEQAQDKLDAYASLLEDKLAGTDSRLSVFQQSMRELLRLGRGAATESAA